MKSAIYIALVVVTVFSILHPARAADNGDETVWRYSNVAPAGREQLLIEELRAEAAERSRLRQPFTQRELVAIVRDAGSRYGIEPELLCAVAWTESRFRPYAVSPMGAHGLMQLMPATGRRFGVRDLFNPVQSAEGGARYLRFLLDQYDGDVVLALAAYNAGTGAVKKGGKVPPISETTSFVRTVLTMRDHYRNR